MERTLVLVRHAKSSWDNIGISDFDRPLNDRGRRDAPEMARRLGQRQLRPDLLLASPARRAKKTADIFAEELGYAGKIVWLDSLYLAPAHLFYEVINSIPDRDLHIAIFAHNPGITEFANELTTVKIDNIPTCGVFAVKVNVDSWSGFAAASKEFLFFDYPKAGS